MSTQKITTPVGDLQWMFIDGEGREDLNGNKKYTANIVLDKDTAQTVIDKLEEFWNDNKPKGAKKPKSMGYKPEKKDDKETGNFSFIFKTNPTYADGTDKEIAIYNAKANKISLGGKKIGNGSKGAISGSMGVYSAPGNQHGVTLYLDAVQLTKFVEFSEGADFGVQEDGGFEGVDTSVEGFEEQSTVEDSAKPRL